MSYETVSEKDMGMELARVRNGEYDEAIEAARGLQAGQAIRVPVGEQSVETVHGKLSRRIRALGLGGELRVREGLGACFLKRMVVDGDLGGVKRKSVAEKPVVSEAPVAMPPVVQE